MHILIIGGNGFLGRDLAEGAAALGHKVTVADRRPPRSWPSARRFGVHVADVTRPEQLATVFEAARPDAVVYLAAYGTGGAGLLVSAQADPEAAVGVNVGGLLRTMRLCRDHGVRKLVWTSSTTVFGQAGMYPGETVDESALVGPASVYGATKVLGEQLSRSLAAEYGVQINALRPTMVWGPGVQYRGIQSGLCDLVPHAVRGEEITVAAPAEEWDLIYVRDVSAALLTLAELDTAEPIVHVSGYRASVADVAEEVRGRFPAARIHLRSEPARLGIPFVDTTLATKLGIRPRFDLARSIDDYAATVGGAERVLESDECGDT
ncbi:epimerase/dehydratase [Streptosporangium violaceochromogenes]|nr:epimerase/dehydratase [Streptosporangium violaceochromogenes]